LIDAVITRIRDKENIQQEKWISTEETMRMLRISSKTTLQKMRDEGKFCFSHPQRKIILYDIDSINK
jgi:hypothetical protein